jgi:hypothetical protein
VDQRCLEWQLQAGDEVLDRRRRVRPVYCRRAVIGGLNGVPIIGGDVSPNGELLRLRFKG